MDEPALDREVTLSAHVRHMTLPDLVARFLQTKSVPDLHQVCPSTWAKILTRLIWGTRMDVASASSGIFLVGIDAALRLSVVVSLPSVEGRHVPFLLTTTRSFSQ